MNDETKPAPECCGNCRFFTFPESVKRVGERQGFCLRYPPNAYPVAQRGQIDGGNVNMGSITVMRTVMPDAWCGEYQSVQVELPV